MEVKVYPMNGRICFSNGYVYQFNGIWWFMKGELSDGLRENQGAVLI